MNENLSSGGDSPGRFYRDKQHGVLCGVCAGIADYFDLDVTVVRILTCAGALFFPIIIFVYVVLCLLVPVRPGKLYEDKKEETFWRSMRRSPHNTFYHVRYKFRELEAKLEKMERYVTSPRFNLDKEFEDLKRE